MKHVHLLVESLWLMLQPMKLNMSHCHIDDVFWVNSLHGFFKKALHENR
jgi:hypothetical protein